MTVHASDQRRRVQSSGEPALEGKIFAFRRP